MNRSDLEKIIAMAEEGSTAKAAQRLFISQPTLSKCLSRVEEELGEALFIRRANGLAPTYALERFLKYSYQILHLYDEMSVEFCEMNEMRRGELKFGSVERMGALVIPRAIGIFHRKFPNISIKVVEGDSISLEEYVASGRIDLAIVPTPLKNESLKYTVFNRDPYLFAIPSGHPLREKAYVKDNETLPFLSQKDLKGAAIIATSPQKRTRQIFDILLERLHGEYELALELNNIETVIRFVANGIGISLVPSLFAKIYDEGDRIFYCQMPPEERLYHEWALIYNDTMEELTRPSRELCRIICDSRFLLK